MGNLCKPKEKGRAEDVKPDDGDNQKDEKPNKAFTTNQPDADPSGGPGTDSGSGSSDSGDDGSEPPPSGGPPDVSAPNNKPWYQKPGAAVTIPEHWDILCKTNREWCQGFLEKVINSLLLATLFPDMTMPTVKIDIREQILKECHENWTCFDQRLNQQRSMQLVGKLMDKYAGTTQASNTGLIFGLMAGAVLLIVIIIAIYFFAKSAKGKKSHKSRLRSKSSKHGSKSSHKKKLKTHSSKPSSIKLRIKSRKSSKLSSHKKRSSLKQKGSKSAGAKSSLKTRHSSKKSKKSHHHGSKSKPSKSHHRKSKK